MRVATDHWRDARRGQLGEVRGHDRGGTPQEAVGRTHHAPHARRDQPVQPALMGLSDLIHNIRAADRRLPIAQSRARHLLTQAPTQCIPLGAWGRATPQRGVGLAVDRREHDVAVGRAQHIAHNPPRNRPAGGTADTSPRELDALKYPQQVSLRPTLRGGDRRRETWRPRLTANQAPVSPQPWVVVRAAARSVTRARQTGQSTTVPYISPSGSAMSSIRAPSGSRKYTEVVLWTSCATPASSSRATSSSHRAGSTEIAMWCS